MSSYKIPNVTEWISGQIVFITGASGFVGKVLLWKLLKSCTTIDTIYVLLRRKKGKTAQDRLKELFSSSMFDILKGDDPETFKKVKVVEGDVAEPNLGLNQQDWDMLQRDVTLFFNAAASVRFDDPIRKAIFTNTRSTKYAILLAKGMTKLRALVHVSTAYSNCYLSHIPEKVLANKYDPHKLIEAAERYSEYELEVFNDKIIHGFPNTYIFTKNLGEMIAYEHRHELPLIIFRPAVVLTSVKEPEPGWCDSFNSIFIICGLEGKGILRTILGTENCVISIVNTDACVNGMIVSGWYRDVYLPAKNEPLEDNIVFNAQDLEYPLWDLIDFCYSLEYSYPLANVLWRCYCFTVESLLLFQLLTIFLHVIPGMIIDKVLVWKKQKPRLMKIYRKMYLAIVRLKPFMISSWKFDTHNFKKLAAVTPDEEKDIFFMDSLYGVNNFDDMMFQCYLGVRKLFGDPVDFRQKDLDHSYRMYWVDFACRVLILWLLVLILPLKDYFCWGLDKISEFRTAGYEILRE